MTSNPTPGAKPNSHLVTSLKPAQPASARFRLGVAWAVLLCGIAGTLAVWPWLGVSAWCWLCTATLFGTGKLATLIRLKPDERRLLTWGGLLGYLCWFGMRPEPFLVTTRRVEKAGPLFRAAIWNLTVGAALLWLVPACLPVETPVAVRLSLAITGYFLLFLLGLTDLWAALYRRAGVPVEKLWQAPLLAASLANFWGQRWNRIFSGFARDLLFYPIGRAWGARVASLAVFIYSGLLHDWAFSAPVGAGFGAPTLYFLIQAVCVQLESTRVGRAFIRRRPLVGRLWTLLAVLVPLPLLFHGPFLAGVLIPQLRDLGVSGL